MSKQFLRFTNPFTKRRCAVPVARILRFDAVNYSRTRIVLDDDSKFTAKESLDELLNELEESPKLPGFFKNLPNSPAFTREALLQSLTESDTLDLTVASPEDCPERGDESGKQR